MPEAPPMRDQFPILGRRTYLNSCSLGALSVRSEQYLRDFTERWHAMGASAWYEHWLGRIEELRGNVSAFLGADSGSLALSPSTSTALTSVIESVPASARTRVVCTELDFPTLVYQWAVRPEMELVVLRSEDGIGIDLDQYREVVDERTAFIATSHVFFATGFRQDIDAIAQIARSAGAYSLIDGYQGAGQIPLTLSDTGVDFYTTGPLKWLCGGPGLAYLYVRAALIQELSPRVTSWFATQRQFEFDVEGFEYHPDARRFEMGTPALPTVHTALGGQELVDEVGIADIADRNRMLSDTLIETASAAGFEVMAVPADHRTAIVMVRHATPARAVEYLAQNEIIVDHRPGFVRISPHFYNTHEEITRCVRVLAECPV